jgi:carboxyl-terminal processing protease
MPRQRFRRLAIASLILVPLLASGFILQSRSGQDEQVVFNQVVQLVSSRYVDTVDRAALYEKAARGLLTELNDPYTELFAPKDLEGFKRNTGGIYGGIGMQIEQPIADGPVQVSRVFPHTPAENAGIREGDRIVGVDTASARGWTIGQVSDALLGDPGTKVRATFERPGVSEPVVVNFTRAVIKIPAVPYAIMIDGIGYVPLQQFNEFAAEELTDALDKFKKEGARGVVLDLRGDPGGILDQALEVSNLFLKKGQEIVSMRGRAFPPEHRVAEDTALAPSVPLIIMTDGGSASASEIVAGALQDHDRALIVGTTSFGKGLVQSLYDLDGGWALKMTTAKWYTPSGRSIQKERKVVNGEFVEEAPDSLENDSVKKSRPAFKSDGGRTVFGGGGITPDVIIQPDTISTAEQDFLKAIAPKNQDVYVTLSDYALELKNTVKPNFTVQQAWRDEFYKRLTNAGVKVDRKLYDSARPTVDRLLINRVARLAYGDSTAKRMALKDDLQLTRALDLLKASKSQQELFAQAHVAIPK